MRAIAKIALGCLVGWAMFTGPLSVSPPEAAAQRPPDVPVVRNTDAEGDREVGWRIHEKPTVVIGELTDPDPYQFDQIVGAVRLSDGRIVVLDGGTNELRLFDPTGSHLASSGGSGQGPGEFGRPDALARMPGDTLMVWDVGQQRASWFDESGDFVRSHRSGPSEWEDIFEAEVVRGWAPLPDGTLLLRGQPRTVEVEDGWWRRPMRLTRADPETRAVDTLGWYGERLEYNAGSAQEPGLQTVWYFATETVVAAGGDPVRIYIGAMEEPEEGYEIEVVGEEGETKRIIRHERPVRQVSNEDEQAAREEHRTFLRRVGHPRGDDYTEAELEAALDALPIPERIPPHGALQVDTEGYLWVAEWSMHRFGASRYWVHGPEGDLLGHVRVPPDIKVLDIGEDYVLGLALDDLGVEHIHLYGLER